MNQVRSPIEGPIPNYAQQPNQPADIIADALRRSGWAPYVQSSDEGAMHLFAARPRENAPISLDVAREQLGELLQTIPPGENLVVATAEVGNMFEGQTYVTYHGSNRGYLDRLVGSLTILGSEAHITNTSRLRRLEALGTTVGLLGLGVGYTLLHRK